MGKRVPKIWPVDNMANGASGTPFGARLTLFWPILAHFDPFWAILRPFGHFEHTLAHFEPFSSTIKLKANQI